MSLRAKLEAVIYAAEEPVTLAQLAALFAEEALAWKAEQQAAGEGLNAEAAAPEPAELPLLAEAEPVPLTQAPLEEDAQAAAESEPPATGEPESGEPAEAVASQADPDASAAEAAAPADTSSSAELEARRAARQRDREVRAILRQILDEIVASYAADGRGVEIREIAGGYRMATKPECHDAVRLFVKSLKPPLKLSLPALETLAVVAYKQPVTAPEVNEIRGVDSSGVFGSLLARKLIATAGRKQVIGRPILYKTTKEFLLRFGLKDLSELPSMEEFEKIAASEFEDFEPASAENGTAAPVQAAEPDLDENASEDEADPQARAQHPASESLQAQSESNPSDVAPQSQESGAQ